jgi:hypothetical protein
MKILVRILIGLVALLLVLGLAAFFFLDSIVRGAVEKGGAHATGTQVTLDKADFALTSGKLDLGGLAIQNPEGFKQEPCFSAKTIHAAWQNGTIFSDELVIDEIALDGLTVNLERAGGRTNFGKILQHIQEISGKGGDEKKPAPDTGAKRTLVVKHVKITNIGTTVHLEGVPLASGSASVNVPLVELHDFRSDGTTQQIIAKLTGAVVSAVIDATVDAGNATLPKEILGDLKGNLDTLKSQAKDKLKEVEKDLGGVKDIFKKK